MRVHGESVVWGSHTGPVGGLEWLQRLWQWLASHTTHRKHGIPGVLGVHWDGRPKSFRPPTTESALEHAAAHGGLSVSVDLYGSII